jgi:hypothetical protein
MITISRSTPITQSQNLLDQGPVLASRWMAMANRLTIVCQDLQAQLDRALLSPVTAPGSEEALTETDADLRYMKLTGGNFTGEPKYGLDPVSSDGLTRKTYVANTYVPLSGGVTLTGHLYRTQDPDTDDAYTRRAFVTDKFRGTSASYGHFHTGADGQGPKIQAADIHSGTANYIGDGTAQTAGDVLQADGAKNVRWQTLHVIDREPTPTIGSNYSDGGDILSGSIYVPSTSASVYVEFWCRMVSEAAIHDNTISVEFRNAASGGGTQLREVTEACKVACVSDAEATMACYVNHAATLAVAGNFPVYVRVKRAAGSPTIEDALLRMTVCG